MGYRFKEKALDSSQPADIDQSNIFMIKQAYLGKIPLHGQTRLPCLTFHLLLKSLIVKQSIKSFSIFGIIPFMHWTETGIGLQSEHGQMGGE